ncbi:MAG: outer membrane beta-barrel protein [Bacteroidetes bacterium]|uniref:Outer membrane beta-barrel protein n=1 Tax=Candidatus Cryptobacteroides faecigallinarum TaxID=2840763 RepID=A0A9D9NI12_9BACT|nr:outer membrane beta-barrel protein [Candidatus Cryptobacteroides faecigallinarum]
MKSYFKLIAVAVAIFAASIEASAQFGVNIGYMTSNTRPALAGIDAHNSRTNGFTVGIDSELKLIGNFLSIQPGLYYQHLLASEDIAEIAGLAAKNTYSDFFLAVPIHFKLGFNIIPDRMLRLYVFAGPTFEIGLKSADKISLSGRDISGEVSYNYYTGEFKTSSTELDNLVASYFPEGEKLYGRFDVMLGGGIGLQVIKFLDIKVGYDYGLVNRFRKEMDKTVNRGQFYVGVGVRI